MIVLDVKFNVKDGCFDDAVAAMKTVAAETLKEDGCAEYRFALPVSEGGPIVLFEEWESQEKLDAHFETSHLAAFRAKMDEVLNEPPTIRRYVVSEAGSL
ncbi:putative quinol monooxygenase [Mariniblastus fucicola]|uniref:Monooxygenase YcnE n=1 Tax=Mariniblastus fucicola TaxID=980251 RepID=A0A5B9PEN4_9BACT|nr:putative quinol monooxygenase [Mariniblastus fucicola]QEG23056.1 Putative monooxygenase YcnE [Mariniblastus fucicola]